jgi:Bacterial SH3 domain
MRNFFPNIETAVIAIFILCVALWGASRCKKKKEEASLRNATENAVSAVDTLPSPAATRVVVPPLPRTQAAPADPTALPGSTIQNPNGVPNAYSATPQSLPSSPSTVKQTPVPMPSATPQVQTVPQTGGHVTTIQQGQKPVAVEPSGAALYVLINGLNVRGKPDLKAKSLGKLKINDQVTFMQEVTDIAQPVRLADGTTITKPWFKIKTRRGTIGWVHGSGVDFYKRKPSEGL